MRRAAATLLASLATVLALAAPAGAAEWRSGQPSGPGGFPTGLGDIGDLKCWQPDRCLLTTAGNGGVQAGLFAYDGRGWYRYSTVCGGVGGRVAWAGPNEFWTVSDQQKGQETTSAVSSGISLCHFKDNQVVASYGEPVGLPASYLQMTAAACAGPSDCWFAGVRLPGTVNQGAFHLHWDGSSLTAVPSLTKPQSEVLDPGRAVGSLAYSGGAFYESVLVRGEDAPLLPDEEEEPSLLHRLAPSQANPFELLFPAAPIVYGNEFASASDLGTAYLAGVGGEDLWAIAGASSFRGNVTVLRLGAGDSLAQLPLSDPEASFQEGTLVSGAAAEPGAAWVAFQRPGDASLLQPVARLARVQADGSVGAELLLPAPGETVDGEPLGGKGTAGPIACPAPEQCWMATKRGWLFHLGPDPNPGADPAARPAPITFRPTDNSVPVVPPTDPPVDDSGLEEEKPSGQEEVENGFEPLPKRKPPLVSRIRQRLIGTTLELSFTLSSRARVRLVAERQRRVVAKTRRYTLARGRRSVRLRLDPDRWPTKLDLQAHAIKKRKAK